MSIPFQQDPDPTPGVLQQRTRLTARVLCGNPGPYTYTGTGTFLVGEENLAVIDPGPMQEDHGEAILRAAGDRPIGHILVTHTHGDHSPLARWLSDKTGTPVWGCAKHGQLRKTGAPDIKLDAGADTSYAPSRVLLDGEVISGDGWTLDVVHTPGHTSNHLCYFLREDGTLFSGDHVMGWATSVVAPPEGDMLQYLQSLDRLIALSPARLMPTHGPVIPDPVPFMQALKAHRLEREAQFLGQVRAGVTTIAEMVPSLYPDIPAPVQPAAALSLFAHAVALVEAGRIRHLGGPLSLSSHFTLID